MLFEAAIAERSAPGLCKTLGFDFDGETGGVELDAAATTPPLPAVVHAVGELLRTYGSVHRGSGWRSRVTSAAYEGARHAVRDFVGARLDDHVVFTRGTTEATNLLSACLPAGTVVISAAHEHHANLLPWTRHDLRIVPVKRSPEELLAAYEARLRSVRGRPCLLAVTGASNVTGEVFPIADIADLARAYGAQVFVDAAQLAPHRRISIDEWGIDYLAFSGHKLYAPFGAGVLVGRSRLLDKAAPFHRGGGASLEVTRERVQWRTGPLRHEAGTPNVVGAVALGVACDVLRPFGMDTIAEHDRRLASRLSEAVDAIDGVDRYLLWPSSGVDRLGQVLVNVAGRSASETAEGLAAHGVGVRAGRFCAHLLVDQLVAPGCGAARASLGLHSSVADVDAFAAALRAFVENHRSPIPTPGQPGARTHPFRLVWST